jgi:hypothetical protein
MKIPPLTVGLKAVPPNMNAIKTNSNANPIKQPTEEVLFSTAS